MIQPCGGCDEGSTPSYGLFHFHSEAQVYLFHEYTYNMDETPNETFTVEPVVLYILNTAKDSSKNQFHSYSRLHCFCSYISEESPLLSQFNWSDSTPEFHKYLKWLALNEYIERYVSSDSRESYKLTPKGKQVAKTVPTQKKILVSKLLSDKTKIYERIY